MTGDLVRALREATEPPAAPDLVPAVRRRLRHRAGARRLRRGAAVTGAAAAVVAVWALTATGYGPATDTAPATAAGARGTGPAADPAAGPPAGPPATDGAVTGASPSGPRSPAPVDDKAAPVVDPGRLPAGQQRLAALVASRPDVFTGLYRDGKVWAVVLGPAAGDGGPDGWQALLGRAAGGTAVRVERCDLSASELLSVQAEVTGVSWPSGRPGFSTSPDPKACAVVVTGQQFSAADRRLMTERFGDRVLLDTSFQPRRLPGASRP